jgi:MFS family permease
MDDKILTQQKTPGEITSIDALDLINNTDRYHPIHWAPWKKWLIAIIYSLLQVLVTILSTSYVSAETLIQEKLGGSTQVVALGQSLFIVGTAVGPAFLGPLSDISGRKWVYVIAILIYALVQIVSNTYTFLLFIGI